MKLSKQNAPKLIIICAVVVIVAVLASMLLPGVFSVKLSNNSYADGMQSGVEFSENFDISILGNNSQKLLINSENAAVALVSSKGKAVFNSASEDAAGQSLASVLNIRLRDKKGNIYSMNSTDNSVELGTFEVLVIDNQKATVTFNMFPDLESSAKGIEKSKVFAVITVDFSFSGGSFTASVDTGALSLPKGFCLEKISILPGLFSVSTGVKGDSYTIPDGCGARIELGAKNNEDYSLSLGMYGSDVTFYNYTQGATLPFFAYTKSGCLANAIITEGDALSELTVKKFANGGGYLYNTFTVTACGFVKEKFVRGESYGSVIAQSYTLSEKQNDYNAVSAQVRQHLLKKGYISDKLSEKFTDLPFFINVLGSVNGKSALTSFVDATEITALLKSRGVRNIALRYSGAGQKGLASTAENGLKFSSATGGEEAFRNAVNKISEQGNSLWLDVNVANNRANYNKRTINIYDLESKFAGYTPTDFTPAGSGDVNENISKWYKALTEQNGADVCLNDSARFLYTDIEDGISRQDALINMRNSVNALGTGGGLMLSYPGVYLLNGADAVFTMPETASCQSFNGVTVVPVLQMCIHGSVVYGSTYMNVSNLSAQDALLKCIEYGAVPTFLFTHSSGSTLDYNAYVSQTAQMYSDAKQILPLLDMAITSHSVVVPGVYKVTYNYSRIVYVNYNPSVVDVNGIMIPARDFVII